MQVPDSKEVATHAVPESCVSHREVGYEALTAVVMSLLQSAKLNGHDPHAYLADALERLPSHPASRIDDLLPHRWLPR